MVVTTVFKFEMICISMAERTLCLVGWTI